MKYEITVRILVDVDDEDAVRTAAFDLLNNAPGEEEFARQGTEAFDASLSVLMIQSRDLEGSLRALCSRIPGMSLSSVGAGAGDVKPFTPPSYPGRS